MSLHCSEAASARQVTQRLPGQLRVGLSRIGTPGPPNFGFGIALICAAIRANDATGRDLGLFHAVYRSSASCIPVAMNY